ncbi:MAG TPA: asparagine synthase (glutamine-hydrolyzing) [Candidatus Sulfotelmatobacter sp.]|nr:asparagine synthase (glutamine-hydrolyzing) [Candidatus Sulfotelmatobacter sp.]
MCGINGVFHYGSDTPADRALVERQALCMQHRGPDDWDVWCEGPVGLGHRRLAIVDLSPGGHQPMPNEDGSLWVTYNGELYGWPEIRAELASRGHRFRGLSDTEALLHLYEEQGTKLFPRLRGMFTFGLYDRPRRRILLGRDRFGIKPLYYHDDGKRLVFASELKALMLDPTVPREVDEQALADYLTFQYVPAPRSIFRAVKKLPAGHFLTCDASGVKVERYWALPAEPDRGHPLEFYRERLRDLLAEAVRLRMVADVPLGAFLSGGIDSSVVVALMSAASSKPVKTFSIGFEEQDFSELEHARVVAKHLGTDHHEQVVHPQALELLPRLVWALDEPFADPSMIPTFYVSEMARRHVTVALSGDGGDEAYAGYTTYGWAQQYARVDRVPQGLRRLVGYPARLLHPDHPLGRKLQRVALDPVGRHLDVMSYFPPRELQGVLSAGMRARLGGHDPYAAARAIHHAAAGQMGDLPALAYLDALTYMTDDVLVKVDRTSMQHSLEARVPLIDHHVMEFVARIPFEYKLRGGVTKWILRESVRDLLPASILARGKQGFGVPLEHWFGADFGRMAREVLYDSRARSRGWLDPAGVRAVVESPGMRDQRRVRQVWALVCLELWAQCYLDRPAAALDQPLDTRSSNARFLGTPTAA